MSPDVDLKSSKAEKRCSDKAVEPEREITD